MSYNGWTNYETWAVGMYLDGNYDGEGTYHAVLDLVADHAPAPYDVAEALRELVEEILEGASGLAADLLGAALSEVDWKELAEHKLQEVAENAEIESR